MTKSIWIGPWTHESLASQAVVRAALAEGALVMVHLDGKYRRLRLDAESGMPVLERTASKRERTR